MRIHAGAPALPEGEELLGIAGARVEAGAHRAPGRSLDQAQAVPIPLPSPIVSAGLGPFSLDRVVSAVERVKQRLLKASAALAAGKVPYAVAGGNAVALWVSRVDESAVRNTQDVDILIRREDFEAAKRAMQSAGFVHRRSAGIDMFLDAPGARPRDAVHIIFARELVRPHEALPNPDVTESESAGAYTVLSLEALVRIKLTAFRDKDRVHVRDLIEVGLVNAGWADRLPPPLAARLRDVLATPDG